MNTDELAAVPQPPPQPGQESITDKVIADIKARREMGKEKYGTELMSFNGRDALWDAYQEQIDLLLYLRQHIIERQGMVEDFMKQAGVFLENYISERTMMRDNIARGWSVFDSNDSLILCTDDLALALRVLGGDDE